MKSSAFALLALLVPGACASFENEDIVIDTRILAMSASVPDQVIDIDLQNPPQPEEVLAQLVPAEMCALIADPARDRSVRWSMTLCVLDSDERCDSDAQLVIGSGLAPDPELAQPGPRMCATVQPDATLLAVLLEALEDDELQGLGGIDYGIQFIAGGEDVDTALDLYAGKTLRVAPRIPAERRANANPTLTSLEVATAATTIALPQGRCVDQPEPIQMRAGESITLTPIEAPGTRETYVVPRLDGEVQTFTESPTYQWLASAGSFSSGSTGGPRDPFGNPSPLFTEYDAPDAEDVPAPLDVHIWVVQRDERLGATWYEGCVRVVP